MFGQLFQWVLIHGQYFVLLFLLIEMSLYLRAVYLRAQFELKFPAKYS
ncbi:hypothetical protein NB231_06705 [Nitrococcus mobilis Nb-231]|uniref:Uncharacterized protein n=1 Tax=Nitrococcus mobilis Nb-231 TaxID=314278 RepID=A4BV75_9GAMM|nr:hypothetical protein NB231_06705 [Nitrococcus mobilis Nb-231]